MKPLWAPWRMRFVKSAQKRMDRPMHPLKNCIFCEKPKLKKDRKNYLLHRGETCFILLNIYPYNNGHLMVAPYKHILDFNGLKKKEMVELIELTNLSVNVLRDVFNPQGFNIGLNLGKVAGAGFEHLHIHVVPRWFGDTNFMPICAETKVIPESLLATYKKLKKIILASLPASLSRKRGEPLRRSGSAL